MTTYIMSKRRYGSESGWFGRLVCRLRGHVWAKNAWLPDNLRAVAGGPSEKSEMWACNRCDLSEWRTPAAYSEADWRADVDHHDTGGDNRPCLQCGRRGFYGPRDDGHGRHYRLCKYCGLLQNTGEKPVQCLATAHTCPSWPHICGAPYIWWVTPAERTYPCDCGQTVAVAAARIAGPVDDQQHPWASLPDLIDQGTSSRFWTSQGQSGRVYL